MTDTKHTPGPWLAVAESAVQCGFKRHHISAKDGDCFMYVAKALDIGSSKAEREANARLIAAAPDMLEALQNIENDDKHMPESAWILIQSAIAKAKGKTS